MARRGLRSVRLQRMLAVIVAMVLVGLVLVLAVTTSRSSLSFRGWEPYGLNQQSGVVLVMP